jgi:1,4-alpha-glucan branching enzyme
VIPDTPLRALAESRSGDPFALLGPHRDGTRLIVRTLQPSAQAVEIRIDGEWRRMVRGAEPGLFEYTQPVAAGAEVPDYRLRVTHSPSYVVELDDPYRYGQVFTGFDLHLFGEGTLNRAFERFGAHRITVGTTTGVHFAVWAPNAQRVSIIGDFNGWDGRVHPMRHLLPSGVWELFVPDLRDGE